MAKTMKQVTGADLDRVVDALDSAAGDAKALGEAAQLRGAIGPEIPDEVLANAAVYAAGAAQRALDLNRGLLVALRNRAVERETAAMMTKRTEG